MCGSKVFTYVHPDGREEYSWVPTLCPAAAYTGRPCSSYYSSTSYSPGTVSVTHHQEPVYSYLPRVLPTPTYTPRSSTPSYHYRSGDESDHSHGSYQTGLGRDSSPREKRGRSRVSYRDDAASHRRSGRDKARRRERIVIVDGPPTPRTPPQTFCAPRSVPSSPNASPSHHVLDEPHRRRDSWSRRPVIVDERGLRSPRPPVRLESTDRSRTPGHARQTSSSSYDSRGSHSSSQAAAAAAVYTTSLDEGRRSRRAETKDEEQRQRELQAAREQRMNARIAKANAEIANRPAQPFPYGAAPSFSSASTAKHPSGADKTTGGAQPQAQTRAVGSGHMDELAERLRKLKLEDEKKRTGTPRPPQKPKKQVEWEDEVQKRRLAERLMPARRASVGPGSRRHRVLYDDGLYRWE